MALVCVCALAACSPKVDTHGYVSDAEWKDNVSPGKTTKQDVLEHFGSPSSVASFGEETWYYVSTRKETMAFLKPEVAKQDVVRVKFDSVGVVTAVDMFDEKNGKDISIVRRTTPTEGHSLGFVEQVISNVGRFNKGSKETAAPGNRNRR